MRIITSGHAATRGWYPARMFPRDSCNWIPTRCITISGSSYSIWYNHVLASDTCSARQARHWIEAWATSIPVPTTSCMMLPAAFLNNRLDCQCPSCSSLLLSSPSPSLTSMCSSKFYVSSTPSPSHHTANQMPPLPLIDCPDCNARYMMWFVSGMEENPGRHFYRCEQHGVSFSRSFRSISTHSSLNICFLCLAVRWMQFCDVGE